MHKCYLESAMQLSLEKVLCLTETADLYSSCKQFIFQYILVLRAMVSDFISIANGSFCCSVTLKLSFEM